MSYQIHSNITAMHVYSNTQAHSQGLDTSLNRLSSGLRINSAADDAAGLVLADSLRSQSNTYGQALLNANNAIGMLQTADEAISTQYTLVDTIKTKATQAAQDGQTTQSRQALQEDISSLIASLDSISSTTMFNGQSLISGAFTNKAFQIGGYSNQTINASIGATSSDKIGQVWFKTGGEITSSTTSTLTFTKPTGFYDITLESVKISTGSGTGLGALAEVINKNSEKLGGVKASYQVLSTGSAAITAGTLSGFSLNGVSISSGNLTVLANDSDGTLVSAINDKKTSTGVEASLDERGYLQLTSSDGRGIKISGTNLTSIAHIGSSNTHQHYGRITLTKIGGSDISLSNESSVKLDSSSAKNTTMNLRDVLGYFTQAQAEAMGFFANSNSLGYSSTYQEAGVMTTSGAQAVMKIADAAMQHLDTVRSSIGSTQNAFSSALTNATSMQLQTKAGESSIRDVDFATESANFSRLNILVQAGNYALAQANTTQQGVLKLLGG